MLLSISSTAIGECFRAIKFPVKLSFNSEKCTQITALCFGGSETKFSLNSVAKPSVPSLPAKSFARFGLGFSIKLSKA